MPLHSSSPLSQKGRKPTSRGHRTPVLLRPSAAWALRGDLVPKNANPDRILGARRRLALVTVATSLPGDP